MRFRATSSRGQGKTRGEDRTAFEIEEAGEQKVAAQLTTGSGSGCMCASLRAHRTRCSPQTQTETTTGGDGEAVAVAHGGCRCPSSSELGAARLERTRDRDRRWSRRQWQWQRRRTKLSPWQRDRPPLAGHEIARDPGTTTRTAARPPRWTQQLTEKKSLLSRNSTPTRSAATAPPCAAGDHLGERTTRLRCQRLPWRESTRNPRQR